MTKKKGLLKLILFGFSFIFLFALASCDDSACKNAHSDNGIYWLVNDADEHVKFYNLDFGINKWYDYSYNEGRIERNGNRISLYIGDVLYQEATLVDGVLSINNSTEKYSVQADYIPKTFRVVYRDAGAVIYQEWVQEGQRIRTIEELTGAAPKKTGTSQISYTFTGYKYSTGGKTYFDLPESLSYTMIRGQLESDGSIFYVDVTYDVNKQTRGISYVPVIIDDLICGYTVAGWEGYAISARNPNDPQLGTKFGLDKVIDLNISASIIDYKQVEYIENEKAKTTELIYDTQSVPYYKANDDGLYFYEADASGTQQKITNKVYYTSVPFEIKAVASKDNYNVNKEYYITEDNGVTYKMINDFTANDFAELKNAGTKLYIIENSYAGETKTFKEYVDVGLYIENKAYDVISIGDNAFDGASSVTSVSISSTITSIGSKAFANMPNLNSIKIPTNLDNLAADAFDGSKSNIKTIYYSGSEEDYINSIWSTYDWYHIKLNEGYRYSKKDVYGNMVGGEFVVNDQITSNKTLNDALAAAAEKTGPDVYIERAKEDIKIVYESDNIPDYYYYRLFDKYSPVDEEATFDSEITYYNYDKTNQAYNVAIVTEDTFASLIEELYTVSVVSESTIPYDGTPSAEDPKVATGKLLLTIKDLPTDNPDVFEDRLAYVVRYSDYDLYESYAQINAGQKFNSQEKYYTFDKATKTATLITDDISSDDAFNTAITNGLYTMTLISEESLYDNSGSLVVGETQIPCKDANGNVYKVPELTVDNNTYWSMVVDKETIYATKKYSWWSWHGNTPDGPSTRPQDLVVSKD